MTKYVYCYDLPSLLFIRDSDSRIILVTMSRFTWLQPVIAVTNQNTCYRKKNIVKIWTGLGFREGLPEKHRMVLGDMVVLLG